MEVKLLELNEKGLEDLSRRRGLNLSVEEMRRVQRYFRARGRNPTDVELETIAQVWSEHCSYKTSKPILKRTILKVMHPDLILVEDAGVIELGDGLCYSVRIESHNHPSAIDPFGGASTGVGGILRDVLCMGTQPVALADLLFFAFPDFRGKLPRGVKHPLYLLRGVVNGISAYGNRVGIPTVSGLVEFHDSYITNCLVNVACVGVGDRKRIVRSSFEKPGDAIVIAGNLTGRDGIHGVTFASAQLREESEFEALPAVQLGDPIVKEPLIHACLEAVERGLVVGMKDLGGGGLSCAVTEMAHSAGLGAKVWLDRVPLRERMALWEIWVSESQERMLLCVKAEDLKEVLNLFKAWDVEAKEIGEVIQEKRVLAYYEGELVLDLDLEFLFKGLELKRPKRAKVIKEDRILPELPKLKKVCELVLSSPRVRSRDEIIRRYDFEVRGATVLKPLQGRVGSETHGDAAVIRIDSKRGLALTCDANPYHCELNPYWGSASIVDEVYRNLVAVGARPHSLADCLNFGNPEKPTTLWEFEQCCKGLSWAAKQLGLGFASGNVSFYNEFEGKDIPPTPTVLGVGIVEDVKKLVSAELKEDGNALYLLGRSLNELGGSEYFRILRFNHGTVPRLRPLTKLLGERLSSAIKQGLVRSCHDLSLGGLFVAMSEMCVGGPLGAEVEVRGERGDVLLFSESNGRWLVEVKESEAEEFEKLFLGLPCQRIGTVGGEELKLKVEKFRLNFEVERLRGLWEKGFGLR